MKVLFLTLAFTLASSCFAAITYIPIPGLGRLNHPLPGMTQKCRSMGGKIIRYKCDVVTLKGSGFDSCASICGVENNREENDITKEKQTPVAYIPIPGLGRINHPLPTMTENCDTMKGELISYKCESITLKWSEFDSCASICSVPADE